MGPGPSADKPPSQPATNAAPGLPDRPWGFKGRTESQRCFALALAILILLTFVGILVLSAAIYLAGNLRLAFLGLGLICAGAAGGGLVLLRRWRVIEWRFRTAGVLFLLAGIGLLYATWRFAALADAAA